MHVAEGDDVRRGELLFEDKKRPGVRFTSPAAGTVEAVHRGARRSFRSIVIALGRDEQEGRGGASVGFSSFSGRHPSGLAGDDVPGAAAGVGPLVGHSARPFGRIADPLTRPRSIFVTAIDTEPLAPRVEVVLDGAHGPFENGLKALAQMTDGAVYVCTAPDARVPVPAGDPFRREEFAGVHPGR